MSKQIAVCLVAFAALALAVQATAARQDPMKPLLGKTIVDKKLGRVLTTPTKQAIYVWNKEPKGKVRCTGACAKAWPPVLVKAGVVVPMHVKGIMGEFGIVR